ncbi:MAG: hypothetical protein AAF581_21225 [Planctomycetota bacterium]
MTPATRFPAIRSQGALIAAIVFAVLPSLHLAWHACTPCSSQTHGHLHAGHSHVSHAQPHSSGCQSPSVRCGTEATKSVPDDPQGGDCPFCKNATTHAAVAATLPAVVATPLFATPSAQLQSVVLCSAERARLRARDPPLAAV